MDLRSDCPIRIAARAWPSLMGDFRLTVVCKATYRLMPGVAALHEEQLPPNEADTFWDDDPEHSLAASSDMVPYKPRADVLLVGSAYAPDRQPVRSITARLVVGTMMKGVEVFGDRSLGPDGRVVEGPPITRAPLRYERAAGGPGTWNPVGIRADPPPDARGLVPLPSLQPAGIRFTGREPIEPIGFGPIAPGWPGRRKKLSGHAAAWSPAGWHERPLPEGFDPGFFNAAPPDQQLRELRGDEEIALENLHPQHRRLLTRLPGTRPRVTISRRGAPPEELRLTCDTLVIDTDRGLCTLVWRGIARLLERDEPGTVRLELVDQEEAKGAAEPPEDGNPLEGTRLAPAVAPGPALPFARGPAKAPPVQVGEQRAGRPSPPPPSLGDTRTSPALRPAAPPLPFRATAPAAPATSEATTMLDLALLDEDEPETQRHSSIPAAPALPPPPAMLGPIAAASGSPGAGAPAGRAEAEEPAQAAPAELTLEDCAAIAADIDREPAERPRILKERGLDEAAWVAQERRWAEAIEEETLRDEATLLERYDEAYAAALERARGPLKPEEHARLLSGPRRAGPPPLEGLDLPQSGIARLRRVSARRIARDRALASAIMRAPRKGSG